MKTARLCLIAAIGLVTALCCGSAAVSLGTHGWKWTEGTRNYLRCSWQVEVHNHTNLRIPADAQFNHLDREGYVLTTDYVFNQTLNPGRNVMQGSFLVHRNTAAQIAGVNNHTVTVSQAP